MTKASELNKSHYEKVWGKHEVLDHRLWSTYFLIKKLKPKRALEIGCGNKPRIRVVGNCFLDINSKAVEKLNKAGGRAKTFDLSGKFPFKDGYFDLVCSFEVLEHLENDKKILSEMARVLTRKGTAVVSFPINIKYWVGYDRKVGHVRRYEPKNLESFFGRAGLSIAKYAEIKVNWPTSWQSLILINLVRWFPEVMSKIQNWLELRSDSVLRRKLKLRDWSERSAGELAGATTALFILKKK